MPLFSLDIRTVSVALMLVSIVLGITLFLIWKTRKTYPGFGLWAAGNGANGLGFLLLALRGEIPDFLSIISANILLLSAAALFLEGIRCFRSVPRRRSLSVSLIVISVLILAYFTYIEENISVRIVIYSMISAVFFGLAAWELIRNAPQTLRFPFLFTGVAFAIHCLMMIIRIGYTVLGHPSEDLFAPNFIQSATFFIPLLLGIFWTFGFVMLNSERLEKDLKDAQAELQRLATTDYLTGIANRRCFFEAGEREIQRARRYGRSFAVLMIDLDRFKRVNDTHGHAAGDRVLVAMTATIRKLLRDIDVFGRLGGEEFAILLPETDLAGGRATAERLRTTIAETAIDMQNTVLKITISIGIAMLSANDEELDAVLKRADDAMYEAKRKGRNRVIAAPLLVVDTGTLFS